MVQGLVSAIDPFAKAMKAARAVIIVAAVAAAILCVPDQTFEIYRVLVDQLQSSHLPPSAFALVFATLAIWWSGKTAMGFAGPGPTSAAYEFAAGAIPILIAVVIPAATFVGMMRAATQTSILAIPDTMLAVNSTARALQASATDASSASHTLSRVGSVSLAILGLATAIWLIVLLRRAVSRESGTSRSAQTARWPGTSLPSRIHLARVWQDCVRPRKKSLQRGTILATALCAGCVAVFAWAPARIQIAQSAGTLALFYLFVSLASILIVGLLSVRTPGIRISVFSLLVLLGVIFSSLSLNDDHRILLTPRASPKSLALVQGEFSDWLKNRKDFAHFNKSGKSYPIFVVSAAGGGIYAASITALFLARIQDRCPGFAQHTFAVSSVSGGSLGASLFTNLARKHALNGEWQPCRALPGPGPFETKTRTFLGNDFLAPIIGTALFPDFFQQFLPLPVGPFDRARGLDGAMETAWDGIEASDNNPYRSPFLDHWSSVDAAPALVLNTFEIESGSRMVISPFYLSYSASVGNEWTKSTWFYDHPVYEEGSSISKLDDEWWDDPPPTTADIRQSKAHGFPGYCRQRPSNMATTTFS